MTDYAWVLPLIPIAGTLLILLGLKLLPVPGPDRTQMEFDFPRTKRPAIAKGSRGNVVSEKLPPRQ